MTLYEYSETMHVVLSLVCLLLAVDGNVIQQNDRIFNGEVLSPKIIGGEVARQGQFPFQGALMYDKKFICGCVLISPTWVISAAHCIQGLDSDTSKFEVHLGITKLPNLQESGNSTIYDGLAEDGPPIIKVKRTIKHPRFTQIPFTLNDICLLEFETPVKESEYIKTIPLVGYKEKIRRKSIVSISGWGQISDEKGHTSELRHVSLKVVSKHKCKKLYSVSSQNKICAKDRGRTSGMCLGDDGGPLVYKNALAGIASFAHWKGCESNYASAYERIQCVYTFIETYTGVKPRQIRIDDEFDGEQKNHEDRCEEREWRDDGEMVTSDEDDDEETE